MIPGSGEIRAMTMANVSPEANKRLTSAKVEGGGDRDSFEGVDTAGIPVRSTQNSADCVTVAPLGNLLHGDWKLDG